MSWIEGTGARLRLLFGRRTAEARMDEELRFHMEMEAERLEREAGLSPTEARRRALVAFGGVEKYREELRDGRGLAWLGGMTLDLKLGVRMLTRYPGLTVIASLALAVAIGAGATYLEFSRDLLRPKLDFPGGERIVGLYNIDAVSGEPDLKSLHDYAVWKRELRSVDELGAARPLERNLITADGRSEPVKGAEISASAFRITGVPPLLGRHLVEADEHPGAPDVVVLGHGVWQARYGGDPNVIGQTVRLGDAVYTVVGVMPAGYAFPVNHGLWTPLRLSESDYPRGASPEIRLFGKLAPGVTLDEAQSELSALGARAAADFPQTHEHLRPGVKPFVQSVCCVDREGVLQMRMMYVFNLFFIALLGICGANVATLVFARTATREGEIAVRSALGASRRRIAVQLFAEALVLSGLAAVLGLLMADFASSWAMGTFIDVQGMRPHFWLNDTLSFATFVYAGVLTVLAAVLVGVVPALKATEPRLQARLKRAAEGGSSMEFGGLWTGIVVSQVAFTVLFLLILTSLTWDMKASKFSIAAAGYPADEFLKVELGFDQDTPLTNDSARAAFRAEFQRSYEELERRLLAEPGVEAVTFGRVLPGHFGRELILEVDSNSVARVPVPGDGEEVLWAFDTHVDVDFFAVMGARLLAGRTFHSGDLGADRNVIVVDQNFVRKVLGGGDAVGVRVREIATEEREAGPWLEIVGVTSVLTRGDKTIDRPVLYFPTEAAAAYPIDMAVHVSGEPESYATTLRSLAAAADPRLRLDGMIPMNQIGMPSRMSTSFFVRVFGVVGSIALLLATAGVYSLLAFTVARRTREIGIRAALGADPRRIVTGIFSRAFWQVGLGVAVGGVLGILLVELGWLEIAENGAGWRGYIAVTAVATFMMAVGLLACVVPARRALRIQPTQALKEA